MRIPQEGTKLKHSPTGIIFEVKRITNRFVILHSMDGLTQIMAPKNGVSFPFEFGKVAPPEARPQDVAPNSESRRHQEGNGKAGVVDSSQRKSE